MRYALAVIVSGVLLGADWPRFRGPDGSGVSDSKGLPVEFSKDRNLAWQLKIAAGNSSPVVTGDRAYVTGHDGDRRLTVCADVSTGKMLWQREVTKTRTEAFNNLNGPATPTPVADRDGVVVFFPDFGLVAYSSAGEERWRTPLGPFNSVQGLSSSPILAGDKVILQIDQTSSSFLGAYDRATGKQRWKVDRPSNFLGAYSTPVGYQPKGQPLQIVAAGALELAGYRADNGEKLWSAPGFVYAPAASPLLIGDSVLTMEPVGGEGAPPFAGMLTPAVSENGQIVIEKVKDGVMNRLWREIDQQHGDRDGRVSNAEWDKAFGSTAGFGGLGLLRLRGTGDLSKNHVRWRVKRSFAYVTSPLHYENVIYIVNNGGIVTTINAETGEPFQQGRLKEAMEPYYASPVAAEGKVYFVSENAKVTVIKAGPKWEILATNDLGERCLSTPAIADGRLFIRTKESLYCFRKSS